MKTRFIFAIYVLLSILGCSKSDDIQDEEQITFVYRFFTVKDSETETPLEEARVTLYGEFHCGGYGCGHEHLGTGLTDQNGEVSIRLDSSKKVYSLSCMKSGYYYYQLNNPAPDLSVIYIERIP